ncbi:hypothetical protein CBP31_00475 [Oceanisphaera profunda]|uniref:Uncharacterized protein n=1 Tax=Oceanisphaera profunda TaxID=1416627 RepID=A0A1Y0D1S8_9GAMM|nr:tetratricopeptide repeat protein [Oceanisphaera profunda]ART81294.1 hypothetical protein CBP31_00475 [Oceanisphaera profunda]
MVLRFKLRRNFAALFVASVGLLQVPIAQAQDDADNVSWADLMVNLPEADMDALATEYLQHTRLNPPVQAQALPQANPVAPPVTKARHSGPSKLDFNEVVLSRADWLSELNQQADAALATNNWPLAELRLAQALGEYQDAHETRLRLAAMLYGRGALGQTRAVLQQGIELAPQHADFRLTLARILAEQQRFDAALQQLNQVHPILSEHLDYYSLKAEVARRSGQCAQAINTYQQLLTHSRVGAWWLGLGLCQRELGEDFSPAFLQARASADLGAASQRFVEQQLQQLATGGQDGQTQTY